MRKADTGESRSCNWVKFGKRGRSGVDGSSGRIRLERAVEPSGSKAFVGLTILLPSLLSPVLSDALVLASVNRFSEVQFLVKTSDMPLTKMLMFELLLGLGHSAENRVVGCWLLVV